MRTVQTAEYRWRYATGREQGNEYEADAKDKSIPRSSPALFRASAGYLRGGQRMNGATRSASASPAMGLASSLPSVPAARAGYRRRAQRLGLRSWPLFSGLGPVGALPTTPGMARGFTVTVLGGWDMARRGDLVDVSTLVVSELSTNIVDRATGEDGGPRYLAGGRMAVLWLRLMSNRRALRVEVWDTLPLTAGCPVLRAPEATEEHGRGLGLVQELSRAWGWYPVPGMNAKCTWAVLDADQRPVASVG